MPQPQPGEGWGGVPQPQPQPRPQPTSPTMPAGMGWRTPSGWGWPGEQDNFSGRHDSYYPTQPNRTNLPAKAPNPADINPIQELPPPIQDIPVQGRITFRNPLGTDAPVRYWLNGREFEMPPGHKHEVPAGLVRTIEFDCGGPHGRREYSVHTGEYRFTPTHHGWEVYRTCED